MQERIGNKSIMVMYPERRSIAALTAACNKSGLRIMTPLPKLHTTIAIDGRPLRPEEMSSMGVNEVLVVVGVGRLHTSWVIELAPVYPVTFYPKVNVLRKNIDARNNDMRFHMSLAGTNSHPGFGAELAKASADLIGLEIRYDRLSLEPQQSGGAGARKADIDHMRKHDSRRR